jgi:S1-C subfamily serine protease
MKPKLLLFLVIYFLLFSNNTFAQKYSTIEQFKKYFLENYTSLDEIEGIWNVFPSISVNDNYNRNKSGTLENYTIVIIKDIGVFSEYTMAYGIYQPQKWSNRFVKSAALYTCIRTDEDDYKWVSDPISIYNNQIKYTLTREIKNNYSGSKIIGTMKFSYFKTFPLESDIIASKNDTKAKISTGTGFAISSNGYIATCNHVIDGATKIKVIGVAGSFNKSYSAKVISSDVNNDLAIIKIDDATFTTLGTIPYTIKSTSSDVGTSIFILGYPLTATMGEEIKLTDGLVSAKSGFSGDITSYQISAPAQPGNSGGPLFNKNGNLIGVVNAKHVEAENATYAVKSSYLTNLIESLSPTLKLQTINSLTGKTLSDQVRMIKNFVYIIEVN